MITEQHLEWSLTHLEKFGGSDVFPPSHDFSAMRYNWDEIKKEALRRIAENVMPGTPYLGMAPKSDGTFRAVHELAPIDSLVATALVYSVAEHIEKGRFPEDRQCVFSYRLMPDHNGNFFKSGTDNWTNFANRRKDLLSNYSGGYVLKADISDFFNQIYLHRVQNALDECLPSDKSSVAKYLHDFLHGLNTKVSKGIPVGPTFSTVISEVVLNDVDQKISSYGFEFIRWVDDIFVFHQDYWKLYNKYQDLSEYLYTTHRLVFNSSKTRISSVTELSEFLDGSEDKVVEEHISTLREERCSELLEELIADLDPYDHSDVDWNVLSEEVLQRYELKESFKVIANAYKVLFDQGVATANNTLIKHVLKKCTAARIRSIVPSIKSNIKHLFPQMREVAYYAKRAFTNEMLLELAEIVQGFVLVIENQYTLRWFSYILSLPDYPDGHSIPEEVYLALELRDQIQLAAKHQDLFRIKPLRTKIDQLPDHERYAFIIATNELTKDERNPILDSIEGKGRIMDVAYCRYVRNGITRR